MAESLIARYWHRKTGCEITGREGEGTCQKKACMHHDSLVWTSSTHRFPSRKLECRRHFMVDALGDNDNDQISHEKDESQD